MVKNASAEQFYLSRLDMFALYTRLENLWFAVVKALTQRL
jgi:hypothetical protein